MTARKNLTGIIVVIVLRKLFLKATLNKYCIPVSEKVFAKNSYKYLLPNFLSWEICDVIHIDVTPGNVFVDGDVNTMHML